LLSTFLFFIVSAACSTVPSCVWSAAELLIIITFSPLFVWVSGKSRSDLSFSASYKQSEIHRV
jgi:hypothetical protein